MNSLTWYARFCLIISPREVTRLSSNSQWGPLLPSRFRATALGPAQVPEVTSVARAPPVQQEGVRAEPIAFGVLGFTITNSYTSVYLLFSLSSHFLKETEMRKT